MIPKMLQLLMNLKQKPSPPPKITLAISQSIQRKLRMTTKPSR